MKYPSTLPKSDTRPTSQSNLQGLSREIPTANTTGLLPGNRLASGILELFCRGAFSFWRWFPAKNTLITHGSLRADSLEDWMVRIHPRDQADFSRFIDRNWRDGDPSSSVEYRFNSNRQGEWVRVRHTASCCGTDEDLVLSCLIESLPFAQDGESPFERVEGGFKVAEGELLQFIESALNLRIQTDPTPRLELLQRSIKADLMVLLHFGSQVVVTRTLPLASGPQEEADAIQHLPLIEAIASMNPLEQTQPFDLDLPPGSAEVAHYIVSPIHWGDGLKGALCAGYMRKEDRIGDCGTTARLSLISAFTDGQIGKAQRLHARHNMLDQFRRTHKLSRPPADGSSNAPAEGPVQSDIFSPPSRQSLASLKDSQLEGATILLVEDETAVRKLVRKLLEMMGCHVIEAASGRKALDLWPEIRDQVSLVVSDVVMPEGISGWDLAKELRRHHPSLGILLTSGYDELPGDHALGDLPQIAFLQKPYEVQILKTTLSGLYR